MSATRVEGEQTMETMEAIETICSEQANQQQLNREVVQQLNEAKYASLTSRAISDAARKLIDRLTRRIEWEESEKRGRKTKRGEKARFTFRRTVEGIIGDLLRAYSDKKSGGWVFRSRKANSFSGSEVSYRNFITIVKNLNNLVETKVGYQEWSNGFDAGGPRLPIRTKATRFRAKPELIRICENHNIDVSRIYDHFIPELPRHPLVMKAGSLRDPYGAKVRGKPMRFERAGKAKELEQQVRDLNEFLDRFDIGGGSHRGYIRVFNQGDHPSFDWNKGGRLYSQGDDSYQRLSQKGRLPVHSNDRDAACASDDTISTDTSADSSRDVCDPVSKLPLVHARIYLFPCPRAYGLANTQAGVWLRSNAFRQNLR